MVSGLRSVIAVTVNAGGGVHLIQTGKTVNVHTNTLTHDEDGPMALGERGHGSVPLSHSGDRHYKNWITYTHIIST